MASKLPTEWILTLSFERVRDNRGGASTVYYATCVKNRVLMGEEKANSENHRDIAYRTYPKAHQRLQEWFEAFLNEELK